MTSKRLYLLLTVMALLIAASLSTSYAQDATSTPSDMEATEDADIPDMEATEEMDMSETEATEAVDMPTMDMGDTCDSDLILNLYIAERYFDFDSFVDEMPMELDIDNIDKGQYETLFTNISDDSVVDMTDEMSTSISGMMAMDDAEFETNMSSMMSDDMNMLPESEFSSESDSCASLRHALHRFFMIIAYTDTGMMDMNMESSDDDTMTESTEEDSTDTDDVASGAITVSLTGASEVPGPGDEDGSGAATVYLRNESNEICVDLSAQNITLPASAAHIHQGVTGEAGPPVVTLNAPGENGFSSTCATVDATLMQDMVNNPGNYYVNIHTDDLPDGAIRGQMN